MAVLERYSTTKCSNRRIYHCLVEDSNGFNNYREECRTPEWVSLGNYPVFRGKYIDYETCPANSYQPFLFRSNEHYKCAYLKSKCSSEGQVDVTGGNKTIDTACRCDYNKGFAFVIIPRNQCACIPSKDDCSCYIKRCSEGETLNPDYQCTLNNPVLPGNSSFPVLIVTATTDINIDTALNSTVFNNLVTPKRVIGRNVLVIPVVIVIVLLTIFITYVTCLSKAEEKDNQPSKGNENSLLTPKESADNSPLLETDNRTAISKEKAEDQPSKIKENSVLTPRVNADIVILHTKEENQKQEVADFKSKLEGISYNGIRYHLFEELFPLEQYNSGIEIQTVLGKCNFIFVYISKDYVPSKIKRFGLNESSINDALEATKTKNKIKKLSDCEPWNMPPDKHLSSTDFDFFNFDYRSKDSISKYQSFLGDILKKD